MAYQRNGLVVVLVGRLFCKMELAPHSFEES